MMKIVDFFKKYFLATLIATVVFASLAFVMVLVGSNSATSASTAANVINGLVYIALTILMLALFTSKKEKALKIVLFLYFSYLIVGSLLGLGNFCVYLDSGIGTYVGMGIMTLIESLCLIAIGVLFILKICYKKDIDKILIGIVFGLCAALFIELILNCILTAKYNGALLSHNFDILLLISFNAVFLGAYGKYMMGKEEPKIEEE